MAMLPPAVVRAVAVTVTSHCDTSLPVTAMVPSCALWVLPTEAPPRLAVVGTVMVRLGCARARVGGGFARREDGPLPCGVFAVVGAAPGPAASALGVPVAGAEADGVGEGWMTAVNRTAVCRIRVCTNVRRRLGV